MRTATIRSRAALYPLGFRSGQTFQAIIAIGSTLYCYDERTEFILDLRRMLVLETVLFLSLKYEGGVPE